MKGPLRKKPEGNTPKPLSGRRILITRPRTQAVPFARLIQALGGEVVDFPTIEIVPPLKYDSLDRAIRDLSSYQWVIFTSVNGVRFFLTRMRHLRRDLEGLGKIKIAAIGPETGNELERSQLKPALIPAEYRAEAILEGLTPSEMCGQRVLLPRAAEAREVLPDTLRKWGAAVDVVEAYRTLPVAREPSWLRSDLRCGKIDMVTFTSSSTVKAFVALFGRENVQDLMSHVGVACIGPITRSTVVEAGLRVDVVAREYTVAGLTQVIAEYFVTKDQK
jgi:uroporphyrinogen III methyltransferase / synthase